eukprot:COSAG01_NODE_511_length_16061_cov_15.815875_2_plen_259_part_00
MGPRFQAITGRSSMPGSSKHDMPAVADGATAAGRRPAAQHSTALERSRHRHSSSDSDRQETGRQIHTGASSKNDDLIKETQLVWIKSRVVGPSVTHTIPKYQCSCNNRARSRAKYFFTPDDDDDKGAAVCCGCLTLGALLLGALLLACGFISPSSLDRMKNGIVGFGAFLCVGMGLSLCDHGLDMLEPQEMRDRNAQRSEPLLEMPRGVPSATQQQTTHIMHTQPNPLMQYQPQMTTNPAEAPLAASRVAKRDTTLPP